MRKKILKEKREIVIPCLVLVKFEGKCENKKIKRKSRRKTKNRFKVNKLFLYTTLNSFHLFECLALSSVGCGLCSQRHKIWAHGEFKRLDHRRFFGFKKENSKFKSF